MGVSNSTDSSKKEQSGEIDDDDANGTPRKAGREESIRYSMFLGFSRFERLVACLAILCGAGVLEIGQLGITPGGMRVAFAIVALTML